MRPLSGHPSCPFPDALQLIPPLCVRGMGCRRGIVQEILSDLLRSAFQAANLCPKRWGRSPPSTEKPGNQAFAPLP